MTGVKVWWLYRIVEFRKVKVLWQCSRDEVNSLPEIPWEFVSERILKIALQLPKL